MLITVSAYILAFAIIPVVAIVVGIPLLLIARPFLRRTRNPLLHWVFGIVQNWILAGLVVIAAAWTFQLLDRNFGGIALALLSIGFGINDLSRISRFRGTRAEGFEKASLIGDAIGITSAALGIFHVVPLWVTGLCLAGSIALLTYLCLITTTTSFPFWQRVAEIPDDAYAWLQNEPNWVVVDPDGTNTKMKRDTTGLVGPFKLYVPSLGRSVFLYCASDAIDESQSRFAEQFGTQS